MLQLDKLGFTLVFVDEFSVNHHTHHNYNWVKRGLNTGVPVARNWKQYGCIAAVTKEEVIHLQVTQTRTNSTLFCNYLSDLIEKLKKMA